MKAPEYLRKVLSPRTRAYITTQALCLLLVLLSWIVVFAALLKPPHDVGDTLSVLNSNEISFEIDIVAVDLDTLTLSVLLFPFDYGKCTADPTASGLVEIFLDPTLASGTAMSPLNNTDLGDPVYRLDVVTFCGFSPTLKYWPDLPLFQADLRLLPYVIDPNVDPTSAKASIIATLGNYPFDNYHALLNMTAIDGNTDLVIKTSITPLAPGFSITSDGLSSGSPNYVRSINVRRSKPVRIYAVLVSVCIAIVSVILFGGTVDVFLWGYKRKTEVLLLSVATLFAFTQLRQTLPGVPPGTGTILDYYVNLPCFFLLALSSILSILTSAWTTHSEDGKPRETWLGRHWPLPSSNEKTNLQADVAVEDSVA
ncbi:hypothetical protein B0H13DRAFT_2359223 [Mycena leptocephala]|nr:hypothetical protein B0H13DRAFT_2359223 [Mycena leptocephala]